MIALKQYWSLGGFVSLILYLATLSTAQAQDKLLMSYGGHNETVGPMWVSVDKGFLRNTDSMSICFKSATAKSV